jgi:hypothetical protein
MRLSNISQRNSPVDFRLGEVRTPLVQRAWKEKLAKHPDREYADYIVRGIEEGFRTGVDSTRPMTPASRNMLSAQQHPGVITEYIRKQVESGNILGPFSRETAPKVHINRMGAIPKRHQPGKWRIITDLSHPEGRSVNASIDHDCCTMSYITVDQIARAALKLGKGTMIAKIDIKSAYRLIPVHPTDRIWQGLVWEDHIYVDGMLPFGLSSAPKIFNAVADAVEWCVAKEGVEFIFHYLDDFAVLGRAETQECLQSLLTLKRICAVLGIPLTDEKQDGPTAVITLLGIIIDTLKGELRLPEDKLQRLIQATTEWANRRSCIRKELESLVGTLSYAAKVIHPGRSFLGRAIGLLSTARQGHHHIRLNAQFQADMMWWKTFAAQWNGASLIVRDDSREIPLTSDASGSWGCGAWVGNEWFQMEWNDHARGQHISVKELVPILVAAIVWGLQWQGCRVVAHCDNMAVVTVVNSRYCRDPALMQLLRCLSFVEARRQFTLSAVHLPGIENKLADDLSRNRLSAFLEGKPGANIHSTKIPVSLLQWLLDPKAEWTSPAWMQKFNTFVPTE